MSKDEIRLLNLAIGRLFRIMSRPYQDGDLKQYEKCREIIMDLAGSGTDYSPN